MFPDLLLNEGRLMPLLLLLHPSLPEILAHVHDFRGIQFSEEGSALPDGRALREVLALQNEGVLLLEFLDDNLAVSFVRIQDSHSAAVDFQLLLAIFKQSLFACFLQMSILHHLQSSILLCDWLRILPAQNLPLFILQFQSEVYCVICLDGRQPPERLPQKLGSFSLFLIHPREQQSNDIEYCHSAVFFLNAGSGGIMLPLLLQKLRIGLLKGKCFSFVGCLHIVKSIEEMGLQQLNAVLEIEQKQNWGQKIKEAHLRPQSLRYYSLSGQLITLVVTLPPPTIIFTMRLCRRFTLESRFVSCSQALTSVNLIFTFLQLVTLEVGRDSSVFWLTQVNLRSFFSVSRSWRLSSAASEEMPVTRFVHISSLLMGSLARSAILTTCLY